MRPSQLNTLSLAPVGGRNPSIVVRAADAPLRVYIRNIGGVAALFAHDAGTLQESVGSANLFRLPPDRDLVILLAPKQELYAAGLGVGSEISIAISEAIPIKWTES